MVWFYREPVVGAEDRIQCRLATHLRIDLFELADE
ncbi:MAG: hypothetical protein K0Q83_2062 [Deltaproteobacteria bacterium]|nr:hypothetical protein [Deltaproteobacteria bacterium]